MFCCFFDNIFQIRSKKKKTNNSKKTQNKKKKIFKIVYIVWKRQKKSHQKIRGKSWVIYFFFGLWFILSEKIYIPILKKKVITRLIIPWIRRLLIKSDQSQWIITRKIRAIKNKIPILTGKREKTFFITPLIFSSFKKRKKFFIFLEIKG